MSLNGVSNTFIPNTLSGLESFNATSITINGVDISTLYVPFINSPSDVDLSDKNLTTTGRVQCTVLKLPSLTQSSTKFLQLDVNKEAISTDLAGTFVVYTGATTNLDMGVFRVFTTAVPSFNNELVNKLYVDTTFPTFGYLSANYLTQANASIIYAPIASPTFTGTVSGITSTMVGLGNVDNTSDLNKPVSTATQTALNLKANLASPTFTGTVSGITSTMVGLGNVDNTSDLNKPVSTATQTALNLKSDLASPTFTGTVTLPSVSFTSTPSSGTGTLLAINGSNQIITTASTINQTATSTAGTYYLPFVASASTGAFVPLVNAGITCDPSTGLIQCDNITSTNFMQTFNMKITNLTAGAGTLRPLALDALGQVVQDNAITPLQQTRTSTNATFYVPFVSSFTTGTFTPLIENKLLFNPATGLLTTNLLYIFGNTTIGSLTFLTNPPTGTVAFFLAIDSSGAVIRTGAGGVPTQIDATPTNTGTLYPLFLNSTAGGAQTAFVESDGSMNYDPVNNILNLPRLTATTQIQSPTYSNGSGQTVTINASGGLISGNQVRVQMQGTTYYYFDQNAFYLTQPVNNVISSILNDLYIQSPTGKFITLNSIFYVYQDTVIVPIETNAVVNPPLSLYPFCVGTGTTTDRSGRILLKGQTVTEGYGPSLDFVAWNTNSTPQAKIECIDDGTFGGILNFYLKENGGGNAGASPVKIMTMKTTDMIFNIKSGYYSFRGNGTNRFVVTNLGTWMPADGTTSFYISDAPPNTSTTGNYGRYFGYGGAIIQDYYNSFNWRRASNANGTGLADIMALDGAGLTLFNAFNTGQPVLTFSGSGTPSIKCTGAGYNWFIGGTQCGYFDTITASGHWRISTDTAQKLILCSGGQNTLQLGNGGLGNYPAEIYGYRTVFGSYWAYTGGGATWGVSTTNFNIGLYVQYTISADGGYLLASDERIKTDIKPAESGSLEVIKTIPIKSHAYIDSFLNGCPTAYNVIAQDIQKFYPEAITITDGFIPDMYVKCRWIHVDDKQIEINIPKAHTVIVGDKVKLILEDSSHKEAIVTAIKDQHTFAVEKWDEFKMEISDELFVYGKNVKDFLRVDKIKLGVLALAGVKELTHIVEAQQHQIQAQQAKIEEQSLAINTLTESLKAITEHLAKLTTAFNEKK
jgi:hypothetical protein